MSGPILVALHHLPRAIHLLQLVALHHLHG
jgi:hypothetical protein